MELPIDRLFSPADWRRRTSRERLWDQGAAGATLTPASKIAAAARAAEKIHKFMSEANEALKEIVGNAVS
jgi:hypothetical protein